MRHRQRNVRTRVVIEKSNQFGDTETRNERCEQSSRIWHHTFAATPPICPIRREEEDGEGNINQIFSTKDDNRVPKRTVTRKVVNLKLLSKLNCRPLYLLV